MQPRTPGRYAVMARHSSREGSLRSENFFFLCSSAARVKPFPACDVPRCAMLGLGMCTLSRNMPYSLQKKPCECASSSRSSAHAGRRALLPRGMCSRSSRSRNMTLPVGWVPSQARKTLRLDAARCAQASANSCRFFDPHPLHRSTPALAA